MQQTRHTSLEQRHLNKSNCRRQSMYNEVKILKWYDIPCRLRMLVCVSWPQPWHCEYWWAHCEWQGSWKDSERELSGSGGSTGSAESRHPAKKPKDEWSHDQWTISSAQICWVQKWRVRRNTRILTCRIWVPFLKFVKECMASWLIKSIAFFQSLLNPLTIWIIRPERKDKKWLTFTVLF